MKVRLLRTQSWQRVAPCLTTPVNVCVCVLWRELRGGGRRVSGQVDHFIEIKQRNTTRTLVSKMQCGGCTSNAQSQVQVRRAPLQAGVLMEKREAR